MRSLEFGINWIWYYADTKEDAIAYHVELMGHPPKYDDTIMLDRDGIRWCFRLHKAEH